MKVHLLFKDQDFNDQLSLTDAQKDLAIDVGIIPLIKRLAQKDQFIEKVFEIALCNPLTLVEEIEYRQDILKDCIANEDLIRSLYALTSDVLLRRRKVWWGIGDDAPNTVLNSSIMLINLFSETAIRIRNRIISSQAQFSSKGMENLNDVFVNQLEMTVMEELNQLMSDLRFSDGILLSGSINDNRIIKNVILRLFEDKTLNKLKWTFAPTFHVHEKDDSGFRDLNHRKNIALHQTATIVSTLAANFLDFFETLRVELAFYIGALNLRKQLIKQSVEICFPQAYKMNSSIYRAENLIDVGLAFDSNYQVIGNTIDQIDKQIYIITGANQGGKTTFLRSVVLAQSMMQSGLYVCATSFHRSCKAQIFTHFRRSEDVTMKSGKLDEELHRIDQIIDQCTHHSMLILNESLASTNENEGSQIAFGILSSLKEANIEIFYVTHFYELIKKVEKTLEHSTCFLTAQRLSDGTRTFKMIAKKPIPTSFGMDIYKNIFFSKEES